MLISFIVGMITGLMAIMIYTNKYLPGRPDESFNKLIGYTLLIAVPCNIIILTLLKSKGYM